MFKKVFTKISLFQKCSYSAERKIGVIGAPFSKGGVGRGAVDKGPDAIRKGGLIEELHTFQENYPYKIIDYGNVEYHQQVEGIDENSVPNMRQYNHIVACNREISNRAEKLFRDNHICLTLGGDHSIAIGTVDAHVKVKKDICILWIDAHADMNTNKTSTSGNVHGMPMAILAKELSDYWPYLPGMDWQQPMVSLNNVAYIGLRSVDSYERMVIDKLGINAFDMAEVEKHGISKVVEKALTSIDPEGTRSIHVSFDIDALDTLEAPSTGTPIPGGLSLREGIQIMEMVHDTGRLGAIDLVEVNPGLGSEGDVKKTVSAAIQIILAGLGLKRRGMRPKGDATLPLQTFPPTRPEIM